MRIEERKKQLTGRSWAMGGDLLGEVFLIFCLRFQNMRTLFVVCLGERDGSGVGCGIGYIFLIL